MRNVFNFCFFIFFITLNIICQVNAFSQVNNSITIREKAGVTTSNYPIQIARPFIKGEILDFPQAVISSTPVLTQADVKTRWDDGSVKHAVITFYIPQMQANDTLVVSFINQNMGQQSNFLLPHQMLDTTLFNFDALISLHTDFDSVQQTVRTMLQNDDFEYWLKGQNVTSVILADHSLARLYDFGFTPAGVADTIHKSLRPIFHATFFPLTGQIRVRYICELANTEMLQSQTYGIKLYSGMEQQSRYTRQEFNQHPMTRWTKEYWIGGTPSKIDIDHNLAYLIKTGMLPNYDLSKHIPQGVINNEYNTFLTQQRDIFQPGSLTKAMGTTGGRPDIGPYPAWVVRWLYTGDWRMKEQSYVNADLSAAWPIHLREADTSSARIYLQNSTIPAYGKPISACSRPFFWFDIGRFDWTYTPVEQRVKFVNGWEAYSGDWGAFNGWVPDNAHQPDIASVPYMLSGDYWYLEELMFMASYGTVNSNGAYTTSHLGRGPTGAEGNLGDQIRGCAWNLRTRARTAVLIPDTLIEKTYFTQKVNEQIEIWEGSKDIIGTPNYNSVNYLWGKNVHKATVNNNFGNSPLKIWEVGTTYHVQYEINADSALYAISPWEMNFMIFTLGHIEELGFPSTPLRQYLGQYLVGLLTHPASTPYNAALSRLPVVNKETGQYFDNWQQVNNAINYTYFTNGIQQEFNTQITDTEHAYANIAMCATSFVADLPNGNLAWLFMDSTAAANPLLNNNPKWAIIPRDSNAYCLTTFTNQQFEMCQGDSLLINGNWHHTQGTFLDTLLSSANCDSIIVTQLTVYPQFSTQVSFEICDGDSVLIDNTWQKQQGIYTYALPSVMGCDSTITTTLTVNPLPPTPVATQAAHIIYSSSPTGNQWYNTNGAVVGAVNQVFIPDSSGVYYVLVTDANGCVSMPSTTVNFILTGIDEIMSSQIKIYPNPADNIIFLETPIEKFIRKEFSFQLCDLKGRIVKSSLLMEATHQIDISDLSKGLYFLKMYKGQDLLMVVKQIKK